MQEYHLDYFIYGKINRDGESQPIEYTIALEKEVKRKANMLYRDRVNRSKYFEDYIFYHNPGNHTVCTIENSGNVYIFQLTTERERVYQRPFAQIHVSRISSSEIFDIYKQSQSLYMTVLRLLATTEDMDPTRRDNFCVRVPKKPKANLIVDPLTIFSEEDTTNTSISKNILFQKSLPEIHYIARCWLYLKQGKNIQIINNLSFTLSDRLEICEALQLLFSTTREIITFSLDIVTDLPFRIVFQNDNQSGYFSHNHQLDFTKPLTEEEKRIVNLFEKIFMSDLPYLQIFASWEQVSSKLQSSSIEEALFQLEKGNFHLDGLINYLHKSTSISKNSFTEIVAQPNMWLSESRADAQQRLLEEGIKSDNPSFVDCCWEYIVKNNSEFSSILEWYCFSDGRVTHDKLIASSRHTSLQDTKKLIDVIQHYNDQFKNIIINIDKKPIILKDQTQLLGIIVRLCEIDNPDNPIFLLINDAIQQNKSLLHLILKKSTEKAYANPQLVLEYINRGELKLGVEQKIQYRNFLMTHDKPLVISQSSVVQFISFTNSIHSKHTYSYKSIKRISGLSEKWLDAFQQLTNNVATRDIVLDALFYYELPLLIVRGSNNDLQRHEVAKETSEKAFQDLIPLYFVREINRQLHTEFKRIIAKVGYAEHFKFILLNSLVTYLSENKSYTDVLCTILTELHDLLDSNEWKIFFDTQLEKISEKTERRTRIALHVLDSETIETETKKNIISVLGTQNWEIQKIEHSLSDKLFLILEKDSFIEFLVKNHSNLLISILNHFHQSSSPNLYKFLNENSRIISYIVNPPDWLRIYIQKSENDVVETKKKTTSSPKKETTIQDDLYQIISRLWIIVTLVILVVEIIVIPLVKTGFFDGLIKVLFIH